VVVVGESDGTFATYNAVCNPPWWEYDLDSDGDGVDDFSTGTSRYLNGWSARHTDRGNCLFADGHIASVFKLHWIQNKDGILSPCEEY
ncbi:MAG: hypothetical protein HY646_20325, partial [Acidobacteria bacterium]|nr:hypothetical protein [Acidobacteriota bacterium]